MTDQDTPAAERDRSDEDLAGRTDDRNEQVPGSPAPDPTEGSSSADDVPTAD